VFGTSLLLVLGALLVRAVGARIADAVRALVRPAVALGHGEQVVLPPMRLAEAQDVGHALARTATLLRERTAQRDQAERAERSLRDAKRAVERSEAFLRGIFEATPDGICLVGADCRIVRANAQAERLFGRAPGALVGQLLDDVLSNITSAEPVCAQMRAARPGNRPAANLTLHGRHADGTRFPADVMANLLRERDLLIVTVRDVSADWAQKEALRGALDDKNTLLKELSHRVKNNLQLIISLFNLQARAVVGSGARLALQDAADRVRAMSLVHEQLCQSPTLASIPIREYVTSLCDQLASAASARQRGITFRLAIEALELSLDIAVPLGLLINELVSNSLKHAFADGRPGTIEVRLSRLAAPAPHDGVEGAAGMTMCLTVADDGVGLAPGFDRTSSHTLGLKLVDALSAQLAAHLTLARCGDDVNRGTCATLVFRIAGAAAPDQTDVS